MTDQAEQIREILSKRMALVDAAAQLNAAQLQNTQQLSGNQIDLMRCADGVRDQAGSDQLRNELAEAEARDALLKTKMSECDERLQALQQEISALDRKLESL